MQRNAATQVALSPKGGINEQEKAKEITVNGPVDFSSVKFQQACNPGGGGSQCLAMMEELNPDSVVKESLTTADDGQQYRTQLCNLDRILAIGYRVCSPRGTQFREWATGE